MPGTSPSGNEVRDMVAALFALMDSVERATRRSKGASTLSLLQVIGEAEPARPSDLAEHQHVHPSHVTRQLQELEGMGYVQLQTDPHDRRSRVVHLTVSGRRATKRLQQAGVDRFALFVADWDAADVRTLTLLLNRLEASKAAVAARESATEQSA